MVPTDNIITGNNILTLIGICTTLIVGVHVHDAFTIRAISKKTELLDEKLKHIEMLEHRDEVHLKISLGLTQLQYQPYTTFRFIFKGFVLAANYKDALVEENQEKIESISIYNVQGTRLIDCTNSTIYVGNLPQGVYYVVIKTGNQYRTEKLLIK